ncbi:hypothetical protein SNEBB_010475 [Seison nebaliae]|nr:hypothetical protein SNEBB_010475 [Seison nebaliae]
MNTYGLLLWKNWLFAKRHPFLTICQLILPLILPIFILYVARTIFEVEDIEATHFSTFSSTPKVVRTTALAFVPSTDRTVIEIMKIAEKNLNFPRLTGFKTEKDLEEFFLVSNISQQYYGAVVFDNEWKKTNDKFKIHYKIRLPASRSNIQNYWQSERITEFEVTQGPRNPGSPSGGSPDYFKSNFIPIQMIIDHSILEFIELHPPPINIKVNRFEYPNYRSDYLPTLLLYQLPMILVISYVFVVSIATKEICYEKQRGLREMLRLYGVTTKIQWAAYFVKIFIILFFCSLIITIFFMQTETVGMGSTIFPNTSPIIFFFYLLLYSISSIIYVFLMGSIFSKANTAAIGSGVVWFVTYVPINFINTNYESIPKWVKFFLSFIPNMAMGFGARILCLSEANDVGIQWSTLNIGATFTDDYSFSLCLLMLTVDCIILLILSLYIDAINPGEFGVPQKWNFPLTYIGDKIRRFREKRKFQSKFTLMDSLNIEISGLAVHNPMLTPANKRVVIEQFQNKKQPAIEISNISKIFKSNDSNKKEFVAVNNFSLQIFSGEITALLGHNGAGKSTLINILTGMSTPSKGTATYFGTYDLYENMNSIRKYLGYCPQKNILFDYMTVEDHLKFFAKLKGSEHETDIHKLLERLQLNDKRGNFPRQLSGGQKRKLCIGIAMTGYSKIIILDEPTSGVDSTARKQIWQILRQRNEDVTLILTTHFMDEADALGNKIAIMANGSLKCFGTSIFLKSFYGIGYHLTINSNKLLCNGQMSNGNMEANNILAWIQSKEGGMFPTAKLETVFGQKFDYLLPKEDAHEYIADLLERVENNRNLLSVGSYGVAITTLEEVFLRATEEEDERLKKMLANDIQTDNCERLMKNKAIIQQLSGGDGSKLKGISLYLSQFGAIFKKNALHGCRNWRILLLQVAIPVTFTLLAIYSTSEYMATRWKPPALYIGPQDYPKTLIPIHLQSKQIRTRERDFVKDKIVKKLKETAATMNNFSVELTNRFPNSGMNILQLNDYSLEEKSYRKCWLNKSSVDKYLLCVAKEYSTADYKMSHLFGLEIAYGNNQLLDMTIKFSNEYLHVPPLAFNFLTNFLLKFYGKEDSYISMEIHPFVITQKMDDSIDKFDFVQLKGFLIATNLLFGYSFTVASIISLIVSERVSKARHMQMISGIHPIIFWAGTFLWHLIFALLSALLIMFVFYWIEVDAYVGNGHRIFYTILLFTLYATAIIPLMYVLSRLFNNSASAIVLLSIFNTVTGLVSILLVQMYNTPGMGSQKWGKRLDFLFLTFLPNYALGGGLMDFYNNHQFLQLCEKMIIFNANCPFLSSPCCSQNCGKLCLFQTTNIAGWKRLGIGRHFLFLVIQTLLYFTILWFLETSIFVLIRNKFSKKFNSIISTIVTPTNLISIARYEDDDVLNEKRIVKHLHGNQMKNYVLVIDGLTKKFGTFTATHPLYGTVNYGSCFGLLGVNGAGKTTTFEMLTCDLSPTNGNAYIDGINVIERATEAQTLIGYCPQIDAITENLTGREHLTLYCQLRGLPSNLVTSTVEFLIDLLNLNDHANRYATTYSGGNKRKLSTAIALVGNPVLLFLDEPTSGMDVGARRFLWNLLQDIKKAGRSIVLTTHSMEESEVLCDRIAIMVSGKFKCLGSVQHLKSKFGCGYNIIAKMIGQSELIENLKENFGRENIHILNQTDQVVELQITESNNRRITQAQIFRHMKMISVRMNIEDYNVNQPTLDQIFHSMSKYQNEENE